MTVYIDIKKPRKIGAFDLKQLWILAYLADRSSVDGGFDPVPCTAPIMAIPINEAIRPYSIKLAPDSSCKKSAKRRLIIKTPNQFIKFQLNARRNIDVVSA